MHIAEIHYKPLVTLYTKSYSMQWDVGRDSCHDQDIKNASMSTQSLRKQSMHWKEDSSGLDNVSMEPGLTILLGR